MTQGFTKELVLFETFVQLEPVAIRAGSKGTKRKAELRKAILGKYPTRNCKEPRKN